MRTPDRTDAAKVRHARVVILVLFSGVVASALPVEAAHSGPHVRFSTDVPMNVVSGTHWATGSVNVSIACDNSSAACTLSYAFGQSEPTTYTGPIARHDEGTYSLTGYAADTPNETSYSGTFAFGIDRTAPSVTLTKACSAPGGQNGWCLGDVWMNASRTDATSGIATFTCSPTGDVQPCPTTCGATASCAWTLTADGNVTVYANATDNAGNIASSNVAVAIDRTNPTPPSLACVVTSGWCTAFPALTLASDATSGVASQTCNASSGPSFAEVIPCAAGPLARVGTFTFSSSATDVAGRSAANEGSTFNVDPYAPNLTLTTTCATPGNSGWCLGAFDYAMSATDNISGLTSAGATCKVDGVQVSCTGTVNTSGAHTLAVNATDVAGNTNATSATLGVDLTAPVVSLALPCATMGDASWCKGGQSGTASASDDATASPTLVCKLDAGPTASCGATLASLPQGAHTVTANATDGAGRSSEATASYTLDSVAPAITRKLTCSLPGSANWCRSIATANLSASDAGSGVHSLLCSRDEAASACEIAQTLEGQTKLVGQARDVAGNFANSTLTFGVDLTPPVVTIANSTSATLGADGWYMGAVTLYFNATDALSNISFIQYSVDGGNWVNGTLILARQGDHVYAARAHDLAGNIAMSPAMRVRVDSTLAPRVLGDHEIFVRPFDDLGVTRILFPFSEPMDHASTQAALTGASGWNVSWGGDDTWLNLTRSDLAPGTSVSVTLGTTATARHGGNLASAVTRTAVVRGNMTYNVTDSTRAGGPTYSFVNITANGTEVNLYCDDCGAQLVLPFNFTFFDRSYSKANVSSNGFLTFDANECTGVYYPDLDWTTCAKNLVAAYWEDLDTRPGAPTANPRQGDRILYKTIGEAPNRVFIVSWSVVHHYSQRDPTVTFQIKLFEGTNDIEVHYERAVTDGGQHLVGIVNQTAGRHMAYSWGDVNFEGHAVRFTGGALTMPDTTPPALNIALDPSTPTGINGWYIVPVNASITATDSGSGVNASSIAYSFDAATWTHGTTVALPPGESTLRARASDNAGNVGEASRSVKLDLTAPMVVGSNATIDAAGGAMLSFNFSEAMDRARTEAALENAVGWDRSWNVDSTVLTLTNASFPYTTHTITVGTSATDAHGVPLAAPGVRSVTRVAPPPPPPEPPELPRNLAAIVEGNTVRLTWSPPERDGGAAISSYFVFVDGVGPLTTTTTGYDIHDLSRGAHTFSVGAVNSAGPGPTASVMAIVPPVSFIDVAPPSAAGWYTTQPTVILRASPVGSTILYDLGEGEQTYTAPFVVPDGTRTLRWHARFSGAAETPAQERSFRVDSIAPSIGGVTLGGADSIEISALVSDVGSGLALVEAIITPSGGAAARVPLALGSDGAFHASFAVEPGVYAVAIAATDVAGGSSSASAGSFTRAQPFVPPTEEAGQSVPLEQTSSGGSGGDGGQPPPQGGSPDLAPTSEGAGAEEGSDVGTDPEPDPPAIVIGDGSDLSEGVRGTVVIRLTGMPDLERLRLVLIDEAGVETLLSEGQEVTEWNTTDFADGFYTLVVRRGPVVVAVGEIGIMSSHTSGDEITSERVLVRNPEAPPVEVAAIAVGAVLVTATAHAGLSAAASGATSSAAGAAGGFDPLGFAQEVAIDAGQDKLKSKTLEKDRRRKQVRSLVAAGVSLVILAALWAFAETEGWSLSAWVVALPLVGTAAALVMAMKYSAESALAHATAARPRVRVWVAGTISLALSAIIFRNPFGYPAYVDETEESESRSTWKMQATRAMAAIAGAAAFMIPFLAVSSFLPWSFVSVGLLIACTNLATSAMPFGPLPGRDVWRWNKWVAVGVAIAGFAIYVGYAAALAPMWSLWLVALAGGAAYTVMLVRFRRRFAKGAAAEERAVRVPVEVPVPVVDADAQAERQREGEPEGGQKVTEVAAGEGRGPSTPRRKKNGKGGGKGRRRHR